MMLKETMKAAVPVLLSVLMLPGCGASPQDICAHKKEVVEKEVGEGAAREAVDGCEFTWKMRKETKGVFQYKKLADCVMDADDVDALSKCR